MSSLPDREKAIRQRLKDDFAHYAPRCLKIRPKDPRAGNQPLTLNKAQRYLDEKLQEQRDKTGKVRALVLKGRQQGISTYIGGRFYWLTTHGYGLRCFILTHEQDATDNLFAMVERYHDNCPTLVKPSTGASNAKELYFDGLESGYAVGTAGTKAVGRSQTIQLFHGCLTPDTPIIDGRTAQLRRMDSFQVGDVVRTHTGVIAPISFISRQRKTAYAVTMKGMGQLPLTATDEHRFLTSDGWRELAKLQPGDELLFPVHKITNDANPLPFRLPDSHRPQGGGSREVGPDYIRQGYDLGRILGLYLAEGCIIRQHKGKQPSAVTFAVHEREAERTVEWLQHYSCCFRSVAVAPRPHSKTVTVTVYGRSFATFLLRVCGEKDSKRLPDGWSTCGDEFVRGLVHGYLSGDGCSSRAEYDRRISAPSIRSAITIGMRDALAALGYGWASVGYHPGRSRYGKICRPVWTLRLTGPGVDKMCAELGWEMPPRRRSGNYGTVQIKDGYAHVPIIDIEDVGEVDVMDFEVDHDDHSYCTAHAATHNSEVAFWPHADTHFAGVVQAIPDMPGTEVLLESTANGVGGEFHERWQQAEAGIGDYIAVFVPWFWQEEYSRPVPQGFTLDEEEQEYASAHGLTHEQMAWRRNKIAELKDPLLFKQEYPATAAEAFQMTGHDSFIKPDAIMRARKGNAEESGPLIIGYDPAWTGSDRHALARRRGRRLRNVECKAKLDTMEAAGWLKQVIDAEKPARVFIDVGGVGAGVYDRLKEMGYAYPPPHGRTSDKHVVVAINFGSAPFEPAPTDKDGKPNGGYLNRRAEMWGNSRDWLKDPAGVQIPDSDALQADACGPRYKYDSISRVQLESKEAMKKRGVRSPDEWDAVALTFAEPVAPDVQSDWTIGSGAGPMATGEQWMIG